MDSKLDFRIQRTYKSLQAALMSLLREKPFEEITVGELCERAAIRRATFYKHFGDKYDLFAFCIRELEEQFTEANSLRYDETRPQTFYMNMIDYTLQFVERNSDVFRALVHSSSSQMLFEILSGEIETDIRSHLRRDAGNGLVLPGSPELLAAMMTGALIYTMKWWVAQDLQTPRQQLVQACASILRIPNPRLSGNIRQV